MKHKIELKIKLKLYLIKKKMGGISNFQIEDAIKRISDEDLLNNFVGVFPSNHINKFIKHSAMIEPKKG